MDSNPHRLAVLIDGDSIDPESLGRIMAKASRHGNVIMRRIYGNANKLSKWEECIRRHKITLVPNSAKYKNAADVAMIIDAVEIFCSGKIDGFCIVASDNDFAVLANWMRRKKILVVGMGSSNTPPLDFKYECDVFGYIEDLPPLDNLDPVVQMDLSSWREIVKKAVDISSGENGWVLLSKVGSNLTEIKPVLNLRAYCHSDLLSLVKSCTEFDVQESDSGEISIRTSNRRHAQSTEN